MKRTHHKSEQIIRKLRIAEQLIAHAKTTAGVSRTGACLTQLEKAMLKELAEGNF